MKRVLVTGGSGFIGRQVWNPLHSRGFEIHATGRHPLADDPPGVVFHPVDLIDCASHRALMERVKPDHLLHLAWYAEPGQYWNAAQNFAWLAATQSLVGAFCAAGGRRVVGAGTCAEYDWSDGLLVEGRTTEKPASQYGEAKLAAGQRTAAIVSAAGGSAAWGRIFSPYGPAEPSARLVPHVITCLLRGEPARCTKGLQVRDFLYSLDVADALVALLDSDVSGPVNIASGQSLSVGDLALRVATMLGRPDLLRLGAIAESANNSAPMVVASVQRLSRELGWQPRHTLDEGLAGTIDWWRDHPLPVNLMT